MFHALCYTVVTLPLFMIFGIVLISVADSEVRPFVAIFFLIWEIACIALLVNAVKALKLLKNGTIEVAEISGLAGEEGSFATKLRELDALKKDELITEEEYQNKRALIMQDK